MKKKHQPQISMFETQEETKPSCSETEAPTGKIDPTACPRCGGKSLVSARPKETGGTHYCPQCPGEEGCFYFTPCS
jgi:DNA-directed RNA polymerase subunit RPC12/RpoP